MPGRDPGEAGIARKLKILVVEDNPSDREILLHELRRQGFDAVGPCCETEEEFRRLLAPDLDLILADYHLPHFSAPRALELLRESGLAIPCIVITGTVDQEGWDTCRLRGAAGYLQKGRLDGLGSAVERALERMRNPGEPLRSPEEAPRIAEKPGPGSGPDLRLLFDAVEEGLCAFDEDLVLLSFNAAAERLFGYAAREVLQGSFRRLLFDAGSAQPFRLPAHPGRALVKAVTGKRKDGRACPFEISLTRAPGPFAGRPFWVAVLRDVEERRRLENQVRQAQKMEAVGRLAGGIAHDFNNLLAGITGTAEMLLYHLGPNHPSRVHLESIQKSGERGGDLVRQLLTFSRRQIRQPRLVDLTDMLSSMREMLHRLLGPSLLLELDLPDRPLRALLDPVQAEQLVLNLALNARDNLLGAEAFAGALPPSEAPGGTLRFRLGVETVTTESPARGFVDPAGEAALAAHPLGGASIVLEASDNGPGLREEELAHLFEPFYLARPGGDGSSSGLGLSAVYGIVSQSGGRLYVKSGPGAGLHFRIHLPWAEAPEKGFAATLAAAGEPSESGLPNPEAPLPAPGLTPSTTSAPSASLFSSPAPFTPSSPSSFPGDLASLALPAFREDPAAPHILIAEDEEGVRSLLRDMLKLAGYNVYEASNAAEAEARLEKDGARIQVLLTDMGLPDLDGAVLAREASAAWPHLIVIHMTGLSDAAAALGPEARHILQKPFNSSALLGKVKEALRSGR